MNSLINLSGDPEILECLATDEKFLDRLFTFIVVCASAVQYLPRDHC